MNPVFLQQIEALKEVGERLGGELEAAVDVLAACKGKAVVTGIGKSGIVGHKIAATLASTGMPAVFLNAGEAMHGDLGMVGADDVVVMLSKSAASVELAQLLPSIRQIGAPLVGLFGSLDTPLAKECSVVLNVTVKDEACPLSLAPTTSTTAMMVMGDALAIALMERKGFTPEKFAVYHPGGTLGRRLLYRVRDVLCSGAADACVPAGSALREAVEELSRSALGAVGVVDDQRRLLGILTEGDIRRLFLQGVDATGPVEDCMTRDPKVVGQGARLDEALERMEAGERKVYVLPVTDEAGGFVGMLRMHDIVGS